MVARTANRTDAPAGISDIGDVPVNGKRLIFLRRDNAIFFPHNSSQEMRASCSIAKSKHLTKLWRKDNASKSCHH